MIRQFEEFTQTAGSRRSNVIRISLNSRGDFSLNQLAIEALQNSEKVVLLFDKINGLIGMRPAQLDVKHALNIKKQGEANSYLIRARSFCVHFNLKPTTTMVFDDIEIEDGVLILDLKKATEVAARSPRTKSVNNDLTYSEPTEVKPKELNLNGGGVPIPNFWNGGQK